MLTTVLFVVLAFTSNAQSKSGQSKFFRTLQKRQVASDPSVQWKNFGPGMSGYCEKFWCHPTDTNVMFMGPDMHVSYGSWDNGQSWQTLKDSDGLGMDMKRVLDIEFSLQDPDFGMALDWKGWVYETTNRGKSWQRKSAFGETHLPLNDDLIKSKAKYPDHQSLRHSELAVDPTNDNVWFLGAGDFWNVKKNHRSREKPQGTPFKNTAYGYIWKTTDKGETWAKIETGLPDNLDVGKIIVNPRNADSVIMATNVGILLSGDGGLSWKKSGEGLPNNLPRDLVKYYDSQSKELTLYTIEQTVFYKDSNSIKPTGGIFKSEDGGLSWIDITGDFTFDLSQIHFDSEIRRYYRAIAYWFSLTLAEAESQYPELPKHMIPVFNRLVVNPQDRDELYVTYNKKHDYTFGPGDVWKTNNGGKNWEPSARQGAYWISGKDENYWKSRGKPVGANVHFAHLQTYMDGQDARSGNRMMAINAVGHVFIGIDQQMLKTSNHGESWHQVDDFETSPGSGKWIGRGGSDLPGRYMLHETGIQDRRLFCSGEHGLWQTTDMDGWSDQQAVALQQIEGQSLEKDGYESAHSISTVAVHPHNPDTIFILMWRQNHMGKLRRSVDAGKTWENIAHIFERKNDGRWFPENPVAYQNSLLIDYQNPQNMYFCATRKAVQEVRASIPEDALERGRYGFYRSSDGGYTWEEKNEGFHAGASIRRLAFDPQNPETIYAALNDEQGGLFKTTDKGELWKRMTIPKSIKSVNNVFIDRNNGHLLITAGNSDGAYQEGGVWRSEDQGITWEQIFQANNVWQVESSPVDPKLLVISVAGVSTSRLDEFKNPGIYLSRDGGLSWSKINNGLGQPEKIVDVKPDPYNKHVLWCASWGCGWFVAYLDGYAKGWNEVE